MMLLEHVIHQLTPFKVDNNLELVLRGVASTDQSEDDYWRAYEATRTKYAEDSFLNIVYDYLSSTASTSFTKAHDVGCGFGVGASELATRFAHVVASDNNGSSLDAAHRFLVPNPDSQDSDRLTFALCKGEELGAHHVPQSADLKKAAEGCISWLNYLDFFEKPGEWEKVVRLKWNNKSAQNTFFTPAACDFKLEPISKVMAEEEVIEVEDPSILERRWHMRGVKDFIDYSFPNIEDLVDGNDKVEELLKQLQYAMGGEQERRAF
ncbi:hypothetical protein NHQ30_010686 [Ciborinia camelliae]|nr:hypothetical protein NHQ30_010686 [Ciborinia camelliae]